MIQPKFLGDCQNLPKNLPNRGDASLFGYGILTRRNFSSRSPPPFGASPPAFGFRAWIGRWLPLQGDGSGFHYRIDGFPPLGTLLDGRISPFGLYWMGFHYQFGDFPFGLYWMGGFSPSDFIGLVSPSDFIRSNFLRIFILLGENDG
ncbi:hypothetical protein RhiirB3_429601 [Rhizophagus irregularis]|nr:hypothetical protein RhiirB3_429601 [Rhizophagus irregularis]